MVQRVVCGTVDDVFKRMTGNHIGIMNQYAPKVDEHKETQVQPSVDGEHEYEEMVRHGLEVSVHRMECMGCKWGRYDPFVVRLMEGFVKHGVMQRAVDPIYEIVSKDQKEGNREDEVKPSILGHIVIQFGVPHDLGLEPWERQQRHPRKRLQTGQNLGSDLVFEEAWMSHHVMVEYEPEGKTGEDEVKEVDANQGDHNQRE